MPIFTWQNVPQTDLSVGQQGVRTAGELLSRAVGNASAGLTQLQGIEDAQKAAQVAAADRLVLQKALALQDPSQHAQMMAELTSGPTGRLASAQALLGAEARQDTLFKRGDEATKREELAYQTTRAHGFDTARDAASPIAAEAAKIAFSDPAKAEAQFAQKVAGMGLSLEDQQKQMAMFRQLYIDPSSRINANLRAQEVALQGKAASLADRMRKAGTDVERLQIYTDEKDARVKFGAESILRGTGENVTQTVTGMNPTLGVNSAATDPESPTYQFGQAVAERRRTLEKQEGQLPDGAKVLRLARQMDKLDTAGVAQALAPKMKTENWAEVAEWIQDELIPAAAKAGVTLTPAQAGGLLMNAMQADGITTWSNFGKDTDVVVGRLTDSVGDLKNYHGILDRFEESERSQQANEQLVANYTQKALLAQAKNVRARVIPEAQDGADTAAEEAQKLERILRQRLQLDKKPEPGAGDRLEEDISSIVAGIAAAAAGRPPPPPTMSRRGKKVQLGSFNALEDVK